VTAPRPPGARINSAPRRSKRAGRGRRLGSRVGAAPPGPGREAERRSVLPLLAQRATRLAVGGSPGRACRWLVFTAITTGPGLPGRPGGAMCAIASVPPGRGADLHQQRRDRPDGAAVRPAGAAEWHLQFRAGPGVRELSDYSTPA